MTPDEITALEQLVRRVVAVELSTAVDASRVVDSVNTDGTVNLTTGGTVLPSVAALVSYTPRAVGDVVLVRKRAGEHVVIGKAGQPVTVPAPFGLTISNSAAPGGAGWEEVVTGQLWAKAGALWAKRVVSDPGTTAGSVARTGTLRTYKAGSMSAIGIAEQGSYAGYGPHTGLAHYAGSWTAALSGKTLTGGTVTLHRQNAGGVFGAVPVVLWRALVGAAIPGTTPTYLAGSKSIALARNQSGTIALDAAWVDAFKTGTADSLVVWTDNQAPGGNAQLDACNLSISYS